MRKFILTFAAVLLAAIALAAATDGKGRSGDAAISRNLTTFNSIVKELQNNYVDSIAPDRAFKEAIDAFLATVDPYTEYYPVDEQETLQKMTTGEYGGIGPYLMDRPPPAPASRPATESCASIPSTCRANSAPMSPNCCADAPTRRSASPCSGHMPPTRS